MTVSRETMLELMALVDGELEGEARERAERLAVESADARRIVDAMRGPHVGAWLSEVVEKRASVADGVADAVMGRLELGPANGGVVRRLDARRTRPSSRVRGAIAVGCATLAMAAGVVLYLRSEDAVRGESARAATSSPMHGRPPPTAVAEGSAAASRGVEVDEIDSPSRGISVFEIPVGGGPGAMANASGPSSVVIWIDDELEGN